MASSPVYPSSPTGTLKRDASKKDSGKLGWVGTLTRRKKGQEGRLLWSRSFYWIIQTSTIDGSWQFKSDVKCLVHFQFGSLLCFCVPSGLPWKTQWGIPSNFCGDSTFKIQFSLQKYIGCLWRKHSIDFCKFHCEFQHFNTPFPVSTQSIDRVFFRYTEVIQRETYFPI